MDLRSGLPYHWIRNGLPYSYPALHADLRTEVLVMGAGITGALCAHACQEVGFTVTVVDARSVGTASTSASTALLQYEIDTPLHMLAERVGLEHAVRSYQCCAKAVEELVALAAELGKGLATARTSLQFASRGSHVEGLQRERDLRQAHGFQVDLLGKGELRERFGLRKRAALLSHLAAEMDPYAFTHALFQHFIGQGGQVFDRTPVDRFAKQEGGFVVHTATGPTIHADHLILATGYESRRYLPTVEVDLNSTYAVASERMDRAEFWPDDCLIWETAQPYIYLRTTPDRRILIGGLDEPFQDPKRRDALLARKTKRLVRTFKRLFPDIPFEPEYSWCGTFGSTPDGLPFIDRDPRTGAWSVLGMGGNGITFSQVGAHIVRNAILGRRDPDRDLFRFGR